jgi:DNA repair protein RadC
MMVPITPTGGACALLSRLEDLMQITSSGYAAALLRSEAPTAFDCQEVFLVIMVNTQAYPIGDPWVAAVGTVSGVTVHPRDVFREAVRRNANAIVIGHTHPSGNLVPSQDDDTLTQRLKDAGKLLGIPILDHIILGRNNHFSYADTGKL